jgi:U3 small nucleolar RNA-associated protein 10
LVAKKLYALINSNLIPESLAKSLLRSLFIQLGEESLPFFASIWSNPSTSSTLRVVALRHATAFVSAHANAEEGQAMDFQMVLPAVLISLQDSDRTVREAGIGVLKAIAGLVRKSGGDIFALDTFYGARSGESRQFSASLTTMQRPSSC